MNIAPFALERYFARYEFAVRYLLSSSDCDGLRQSEVLSFADAETAELWDSLTLSYTESLGLPLLRQEIAGLYAGVRPDEVLVAAPEEGIFLAMHALLRAGDHVICTWPGYQSLYEVATDIGCEVSRWEPDEAAGWHFEVKALPALVRSTTKLIVCNFPHNPTGSTLTREEYEGLVDLARRHGIHLFSDEMYKFLEADPAARLPSACEQYERGITLSGMSKSLGLPGARIGWLVTQDRALYARVAALKDYTTICSSAPSEVLALIALRAKERILARHNARIRRNVEIFQSFLEAHEGLFRCVMPRGGTMCFPRYLGPEGASVFADRVRSGAGIMLLPSSMYGYGDSHVRVGLGRENVPQILELLHQYLAG